MKTDEEFTNKDEGNRNKYGNSKKEVRKIVELANTRS